MGKMSALRCFATFSSFSLTCSTMIRISILVPEQSVMQAIADPQYIFSAVNQFLITAGKDPVFDIQLIGIKPDISLMAGFSVHVNRLISEDIDSDLVIIPALAGDMALAIEANRHLIPWITEQYRKGSEIASLCVGAFLLGATGLLNGRKCSTHWGFQNQFREMFPLVEVVDGNIITYSDRLYSSGGANSYWNLLLHLVEKYTDREMAILASKYFAIDMGRESQNSFAMFRGQKSHQDSPILKAQNYIEQHIHDRILVDDLAELVAMGRRSFERRFKSATNNSVLEYIHRIKVEAAKRQFESGQKNINEVMYGLGYTDAKAFRVLFKKITGLSPLEYRNIYTRTAWPDALLAH